MSSITGIELGSESCTLVAVRTRGGRDADILALHTIPTAEWPRGSDVQADILGAVRRDKRFPRSAAVVLWGSSEIAADAAAARAAVRPLEEAGFHVESIVSPPEALVRLAATRQRRGAPGATAWVALNSHAVAIAIVHGEQLLFSRTFEWTYKPDLAETKAQLLQRYSLVARLAPELQHGIHTVRASHGVGIDAVVTCGDLPELRSLTMPLIEELDLEVETLDSTEGLHAARSVTTGRLSEAAPAIRLATAAALIHAGAPPALRPAALETRWGGAMLQAAAAAALIGAVAWVAYSYRTELRHGAADVPRAATQSDRTLPAPNADREPPPARASVTSESTPVSTVLSIESDRSPQKFVEPETNPSVRRRRASSAAAPVPQVRRANRDPLPKLDSILVDQDRRLALIDGAAVGVGDDVGTRTVIQIDRDAIFLRETSGLVIRLPLRPRR